MVPGEFPVAERMVLVHLFALADMLCDRADRPRPRRWDPFPFRSGSVIKVAEKGMPSPSLERLVEEIDVLVERCTRHKPSMLRVESAGDWRTARKYEFGLASSRPQKSASERTRPSERGRPR